MINWPNSLIEDLARRKCVIFLGAGISKNAQNQDGRHPDDWNGFLKKGLSHIDDRKNRNLVDKHIKSDDYLMACELLRRILGRDPFVDLLKDEFQNPRFRHADVHNDIFMLDSRIVITPNFDKIYDTYAAKESEGTVIVKNYYDTDVADHIRHNERLILKIHGCISSPDKLIFSRLDYAEARNNYKSFYAIIEALIVTHTFLFLGAGLNDPDIKLLLEDYSFRYKNTKKHQFVIPKKAISDNEIDIYEESMNLNIIQYDSKNTHEELLKSIKELVTLVDAERQKITSSSNW